MSQELTNKRPFPTDQVLRLATALFLIGAAWARLEYKMDAATAETRSIFKEYVVQNEADKKMIKYQHDILVKQVEVNELTIQTIANYLKPDEPTIRDKRYR